MSNERDTAKLLTDLWGMYGGSVAATAFDYFAASKRLSDATHSMNITNTLQKELVGPWKKKLEDNSFTVTNEFLRMLLSSSRDTYFMKLDDEDLFTIVKTAMKPIQNLNQNAGAFARDGFELKERTADDEGDNDQNMIDLLQNTEKADAAISLCKRIFYRGCTLYVQNLIGTYDLNLSEARRNRIFASANGFLGYIAPLAAPYAMDPFRNPVGAGSFVITCLVGAAGFGFARYVVHQIIPANWYGCGGVIRDRKQLEVWRDTQVSRFQAALERKEAVQTTFQTLPTLESPEQRTTNQTGFRAKIKKWLPTIQNFAVASASAAMLFYPSEPGLSDEASDNLVQRAMYGVSLATAVCGISASSFVSGAAIGGGLPVLQDAAREWLPTPPASIGEAAERIIKDYALPAAESIGIKSVVKSAVRTRRIHNVINRNDTCKGLTDAEITSLENAQKSVARCFKTLASDASIDARSKFTEAANAMKDHIVGVSGISRIVPLIPWADIPLIPWASVQEEIMPWVSQFGMPDNVGQYAVTHVNVLNTLIETESSDWASDNINVGTLLDLYETGQDGISPDGIFKDIKSLNNIAKDISDAVGDGVKVTFKNAPQPDDGPTLSMSLDSGHVTIPRFEVSYMKPGETGQKTINFFSEDFNAGASVPLIQGFVNACKAGATSTSPEPERVETLDVSKFEEAENAIGTFANAVESLTKVVEVRGWETHVNNFANDVESLTQVVEVPGVNPYAHWTLIPSSNSAEPPTFLIRDSFIAAAADTNVVTREFAQSQYQSEMEKSTTGRAQWDQWENTKSSARTFKEHDGHVILRENHVKFEARSDLFDPSPLRSNLWGESFSALSEQTTAVVQYLKKTSPIISNTLFSLPSGKEKDIYESYSRGLVNLSQADYIDFIQHASDSSGGTPVGLSLAIQAVAKDADLLKEVDSEGNFPGKESFNSVRDFLSGIFKKVAESYAEGSYVPTAMDLLNDAVDAAKSPRDDLKRTTYLNAHRAWNLWEMTRGRATASP